MLWSLLLALLISVSGLRDFLDPKSPDYVEGLGWITAALQQLSNITVPLALFSTGVWMYGKKLAAQPLSIAVVLLLKFILLPLLQLACAKAWQLDVASSMSLVLLSVTPTASGAFVVSSHYAHGTELITLVMVVGTALLVPLVVGWLYLPGYIGVWEYDLTNLTEIQ